MRTKSLSQLKFIFATGAAALILPATAHAQYLASEWAPMDDSESAAP